MKKILLSMTALFAVGFINAQIYSANDSTAFAAWTPYDSDGDGNNWMAVVLSGGTALDAQGGVMFSASYGSAGPLTPDNLNVSPVINCATNATVYLNWAAGNPETTASGWYEEHYAVYVVTNPAAIIATGTYPTPVWEGTLTAGEVMQPQSVNISSIAANQASVYVIFRHFNCTDENWIVVDDLTVTAAMPVGIEEVAVEAAVYPNPTNSVLNVKTTAEATSISIISMDGKVVATSVINGLTGSVNVAELVNGVYFYEVAAANGSVIRNTFVKN